MGKENNVGFPLILCFLLLFIDVKGANTSARKLLTNIKEDGNGGSMVGVHGSHSKPAPSSIGHESAPKTRGVSAVNNHGISEASTNRGAACGRSYRYCVPRTKKPLRSCTPYSRQGC